MDNLHEYNLNNKYFKAPLKSFDDKKIEKLVIFKYVLTEDRSIYAKVIGFDDLIPVYHRCEDGILQGCIMHDEYSRIYIESPFETIIHGNDIISNTKLISEYQIDNDVIGYTLLRNEINKEHKSRGLK